MLASDLSLRITEIFYSLQGESSLVGERTVFIRLTGCPLRCTYCDSAYAFQGGEQQPLAQTLSTVAEYNARFVCVTGGEPLAQPAVLDLMAALCDRGYSVSLETSGALDISAVDNRVKRIVDWKTPSSQESHRNLLDNIQHLVDTDEIKFVIGSRDDYLWATDMLRQHRLQEKVHSILFSPVSPIESDKANGLTGSEGLKPTQLADWILQDKLDVRMQIQMHKLLWGGRPGH